MWCITKRLFSCYLKSNVGAEKKSSWKKKKKNQCSRHYNSFNTFRKYWTSYLRIINHRFQCCVNAYATQKKGAMKDKIHFHENKNIFCMSAREWKPESINQTRILNRTVQHTHTRTHQMMYKHIKMLLLFTRSHYLHIGFLNHKRVRLKLSDPYTQISELTQLGSPGVFRTWPILCVTHDQRVRF